MHDDVNVQTTPATLAETAVLVDAAGQAGVPVLLIGNPGIGKSSMLTALAAARGLHLEIVTASVHDPTDFNGMPIKVTISLGVATLLDSDFVQPDDLIACADKYLYRAKNGGRNRVEGKMISGV